MSQQRFPFSCVRCKTLVYSNSPSWPPSSPLYSCALCYLLSAFSTPLTQLLVRSHQQCLNSVIRWSLQLIFGLILSLLIRDSSSRGSYYPGTVAPFCLDSIFLCCFFLVLPWIPCFLRIQSLVVFSYHWQSSPFSSPVLPVTVPTCRFLRLAPAFPLTSDWPWSWVSLPLVPLRVSLCGLELISSSLSGSLPSRKRQKKQWQEGLPHFKQLYDPTLPVSRPLSERVLCDPWQCLLYRTEQAQDVKKIEKFHSQLMRLMVAKESRAVTSAETDWTVDVKTVVFRE